jgi:hypothetical protein
MKLSTIAGSSVTPHPDQAQPVAASGQSLAATSDTSITVVSGAMYAITVTVGYLIAGWLTTGTAANIVFACGTNQTIIIEVPVGQTDLHYNLVGTSPLAWLRRIQQ